jgi:hypothetical protein
MATCDTLEVDLSPPPPINITLEQYPCIDIEILSPDITIEAVTVANQGPKGDQGPIGPIGQTGPAGPQGVQGVAGPQGIQGVAGPQGDLGPQGLQGPPGPTGATGGAGPTGPQGPAGLQGNAGPAATIAVGTTTTGAPGSNASVSNSGSSSAATFNFTIPRGDVGPQGPPGPAGSGTGDMLRSVYDTNGNNVCDAAESVPWTGVTGKPATFSPSPHANTHLSAGSDPIAIATSVLAGLCPAVDNTTIQVVANKLSAVALAWTAITGKPSTFPPDSTAMLKSVYDTNADNIVDHAALADTAPWTGITGKPASFAPSAHAASHVTGGSDIIVPASTSTAGLLKQLSGNTTDFVDGTNTCQNLVNAVQPVIWSARLRSYNSISNPTFEGDQRNVGNAVVNPAAGTLIIDRWMKAGGGTYTVNCRQVTPATIPVVPGTNFQITSKIFQVNLQTAQASLAAGDFLTIRQNVEGIKLRELINDVHSVSLLVQSTVAPLSFSLALRDAGNTRSLVKLCTISTANVWTLIPLANIPIWSASGSFNLTPGALGYLFEINLACGSTFMAPAADTWQNGQFYGAPGMSNFCNNVVNTIFAVAMVQHEPGALCTTLQDCPWQQNYDDCLRYYQKTYDYTVATGTVTAIGCRSFSALGAGATLAFGPASFHKPLAKTPTMVLYNQATGAANSVQDGAGTNHASAGCVNIGTSGFTAINYATGVTAASAVYAHYTADTGW